MIPPGDGASVNLWNLGPVLAIMVGVLLGPVLYGACFTFVARHLIGSRSGKRKMLIIGTVTSVVMQLVLWAAMSTGYVDVRRLDSWSFVYPGYVLCFVMHLFIIGVFAQHYRTHPGGGAGEGNGPSASR